jgi:hypothetical protein
MIGLDLNGQPATQLPAAAITGAVLHQASGVVVVSYRDSNGSIVTRVLSDQSGPDLFRALQAIQAASLSSTPTTLEAAAPAAAVEPEPEPPHEHAEHAAHAAPLHKPKRH